MYSSFAFLSSSENVIGLYNVIFLSLLISLPTILNIKVMVPCTFSIESAFIVLFISKYLGELL